MKITIDTKEDSHQEIRNIIKMLSSLVGEKEVLSNEKDIFADEGSQEQNQNIFSMFGSTSSGTKTDEDKAEDDNQDDASEMEIVPKEVEEKEPVNAELDLDDLEEYD